MGAVNYTQSMIINTLSKVYFTFCRKRTTLMWDGGTAEGDGFLDVLGTLPFDDVEVVSVENYPGDLFERCSRFLPEHSILILIPDNIHTVTAITTL